MEQVSTCSPLCSNLENAAEQSYSPETQGESHSACIEPGECSCDDEEIYEQIAMEFYRELVIEHCISVHRSLKRGALLLDEESEADEDEKKIGSMILPSNEYDDAGSPLVKCPNCKKYHKIDSFGIELGQCMRLNLRSSTRSNKSKKSIDYNTDRNDDDDDEEYGERKKKKPTKRKHSGKNGASKSRAKSSRMESEVPFVSLSHEEKVVFFSEFCGVPTKRGGRNCKKKPTCTVHTEQQKSDVRRVLEEMGSTSKPCMESFQFDKDTVDEGSSSPFEYISCPPPVKRPKERIVLKISKKDAKAQDNTLHCKIMSENVVNL